MRMRMVMNLYSAFSINIFKSALQASDLWVRSDISKTCGIIDRHTEVVTSAAAIRTRHQRYLAIT